MNIKTLDCHCEESATKQSIYFEVEIAASSRRNETPRNDILGGRFDSRFLYLSKEDKCDR